MEPEGRSKRTEPKKWVWKKQEGFPKRPLHAYNCFYRDERKRILDDNNSALNGGLTGLSAVISQRWKELPQELKEPYLNEARAEKTIYLEAVKTFRQENLPRKKRIRKRKPKVPEQIVTNEQQQQRHQQQQEEPDRTWSDVPNRRDDVTTLPLSSIASPDRFGYDYMATSPIQRYDDWYHQQQRHHHWLDTSRQYSVRPHGNNVYPDPVARDVPSHQTMPHFAHHGATPPYPTYNDYWERHSPTTKPSTASGCHPEPFWYKKTRVEDRDRSSISYGPPPIPLQSSNPPTCAFYPPTKSLCRDYLREHYSDSSTSTSSYNDESPQKTISSRPGNSYKTCDDIDSETLFSRRSSTSTADNNFVDHNLSLVPRHASDIHLAYFPCDDSNANQYS